MAQGSQDRNRPALTQIRVETFRGKREQYRGWKKTIEAQRALYKLQDEELAVLIYLSTAGEPREILDQLEIQDMREAGGLNRVMRLLDEAYGARSDERFEEKQEAYLTYRRQPGVNINAYLANLKRLKGEYLREDEQTQISDKAFAQRMLTRASITKKERTEVFFAAGGRYDSKAIERVLRFRCAQIHQDEKDRYLQAKKTSYRQRPTKGKFHKRSSKAAHWADYGEEWDEEGDEDDEEEDLDNEDLEREMAYESYYQQQWEDDDSYGYGYEEYDDRWDGGQGEKWWSEDSYDDSWSQNELREAYAAGWTAKAQSAGARKARGYKGSGKGPGKSKGKGKGKKRPPDERAIAKRKEKSTCAACGGKGHWRGDPECPRVQAGEDQARSQASSSRGDTLFTEREEKRKTDRMRHQAVKSPSSPSPTPDPTDGPRLAVNRVNWTLNADSGPPAPEGAVIAGEGSTPQEPSEPPPGWKPPVPEPALPPAKRVKAEEEAVEEEVQEEEIFEEEAPSAAKEEHGVYMMDRMKDRLGLSHYQSDDEFHESDHPPRTGKMDSHGG